MSLKPLKTLRYADRVRLEYSVVDGHPQSFPALASDARCTWDNLRLLCTPPRTTDDDCVARAWEMLQKEIEGSQDTGTGDFDLKLARATLGITEEE